MKTKKIISLLITLYMMIMLSIFSLPVIADDTFGAQVKIGDITSVYLTIEDAFGSVPDNGKAEIKLFSDMNVNRIISVSSGQTIILDLNGHSLTGHNEVFENIGTLILTDTSSSKSGKIFTNDILPGNIINDDGSLNLSLNHMPPHKRSDSNLCRKKHIVSNSAGSQSSDSKKTLPFFIAAVILIVGVVEYRYIKITLQ